MQGPDFKSQFVDPAPASNADLGRTIAQSSARGLRDRQARRARACVGRYPTARRRSVTSRVVTSDPRAQRTGAPFINMQAVGDDPLFRRGRFPGRTVGLTTGRRCRVRPPTRESGNGSGARIRSGQIKLRRVRRPSAASQLRMARFTSSKQAGRPSDHRLAAGLTEAAHHDRRARNCGGDRFHADRVLDPSDTSWLPKARPAKHRNPG